MEVSKGEFPGRGDDMACELHGSRRWECADMQGCFLSTRVTKP